jgi:hypothetical protein
MDALRKLINAFDLSDTLLIVGVVSLIGGIATIHRPSAAIVFGVLCLAVWLRKSSTRDGA